MRLTIAAANVDDAIEIFVVDLVGRVAGPVVVGVRAREEAERRHAGLVEAGDVGRLIRIRLQHEIEAGGDVRLLEDLRPHRARAGRLHGQLVVDHAADHVEVEIRGQLVDRHRRLVDERVRADQADLFGRPERQQHVAPARLLRQRLGDRRARRPCPTRCRPRRDGCCPASSLLGERVAVAAAPEVIVVRAERDPRPLDAGRSALVAGRYATTLRPVCVSRCDRGLDRDRRRPGIAKPATCGLPLVELLLHGLEVLACRRGEDRASRPRR